ncbi:MAG: monothiol bacilliredoxin BrxC family protein [Planctomycetota bacterium]
MSDSTILPLTEKKLPGSCYVFKHSTRCPVSTRAAGEVKGQSLDLPLYWINVIEQRDLSDWVAETYGVKHESPQLLRIENQDVTTVWNHGEIRREKIG